MPHPTRPPCRRSLDRPTFVLRRVAPATTAFAALLALAAACGDAAGPLTADAAVGTYVLRFAGGDAIPAVRDDGGALLADTLVVTSDHRWTEIFRYTVGPADPPRRAEDHGGWHVAADTLYLSHIAGSTTPPMDWAYVLRDRGRALISAYDASVGPDQRYERVR